MKAIILAAGEGKRLRPLTENIPKCMVKLFNKSIIERQLENFRKNAIQDISIITSYCSNIIKFDNVKYYHNKNYNSTNMIETLFCAEHEMNDDIIISYGDIIYEKKVLQKLIKSKEEYSVIIDKNWFDYWKKRFDNPLADAESLELNHEQNIIDIGQKSSSIDKIQGQYIGLMKFQLPAIEFLRKFYYETKFKAKNGTNPLNPKLNFEQSYMTDLLRGLINKGKNLKAIPIHGGWLELDTLNDYELYHKMFTDGTLKQFFSYEEL